MKYTKEVSAVQWTGNNLEEVEKFTSKIYYPVIDRALYWNGEYTLVGDYIIKDREMGMYSCSEALFNELYTKVEDE